MTETLTTLFSFGTILLNISTVLLLLSYILWKDRLIKKSSLAKNVIDRAVLISFFLSLFSVLGSLYFSEIAKYTPCKLCWFQRILMYPLPLLFGISLWKKKRDVIYYTLPMTIIGSFIALYHYYIQIYPSEILPCSSVGYSASCSDRFVTNYGYITLPFMSLSVFVFVSLVLYFKLRIKK